MADNILPFADEEIITGYDEITTEAAEDITIKRSFKFDAETKQFIFANGKNVELTEVEAIKQWIKLILRTYKDKFNIYKGTTFYCNVEDLIGARLNTFNRSELQREITESILTNRAIDTVDNFALTQLKRTLTVEFNVTLKNTELIKVSEVI